MMLTLPLAFEERMKEMLKEEWDAFYSCFSEDRYQALRLNTLKLQAESAGAILAKLDPAGVQSFAAVPWAKAGYYYTDDIRPGRHPFHEMGLYYIQEPSAMSAAAVLSPEPDMRVLDLCAAPGGKSTQLASMMEQEGLLVANEINPQRAKILSQNIERMGIRNCLVTNEDSNALSMRFPAFFHKILVDAPCSGEGMFRKNPLAMNEWSPQNVDLCASRQEEILDNAAKMLLPGGELVYSTCTFAPQENERSIEAFLKRNPDFYVKKIEEPSFDRGRAEITVCPEEADWAENTCRLWPHKLHGEGHYVARLGKRGELSTEIFEENPSGKGRKPKPSILDKEKQKCLNEFLRQTFCDAKAFAMESRYMLFGEHLYLVPGQLPSLRGIRVLRCGLELGEFKKNRFEPSHALALTLCKEDCRAVVDLAAEDPRVEAYYRGEAIQLHEDDFAEGKSAAKGWCLVCIEGYSAGWGKLTGYTLKNHYPKGLRYDYSLD